MAATSPSRVRKSAGVARQYCGRLGKVANCQGGMFLAYVSPLGRALVDKRLYLPKSWTSDQDRCAAAGVPEDRRNYRSKTELALELLERVPGVGPPQGRVGCRRRRLRDVADLPGGTGGPGDALGAGRSGRALRSGPWSRLGPVRNIRGSAAPANPSCGLGSGGPWSSAVMNCRMRLGGR